MFLEKPGIAGFSVKKIRTIFDSSAVLTLYYTVRFIAYFVNNFKNLALNISFLTVRTYVPHAGSQGPVIILPLGEDGSSYYVSKWVWAFTHSQEFIQIFSDTSLAKGEHLH